MSLYLVTQWSKFGSFSTTHPCNYHCSLPQIALVEDLDATTSTTVVDANLRSWTSQILFPNTLYTVHVSAETGGEGGIGEMSNTMTITTLFGGK